jgi:hypothetical protein
MDRFAFLDSQPWLSPVAASAKAEAPVFTGVATLSWSLTENSVSVPPLPQGACAPDAKHLFFLTTADTPDATCLRVEVYASDSAPEVLLVLDGRPYRVVGQALRVNTLPPAGARPPFVALVFNHITLNLLPGALDEWTPNCGLVAAAQAFERCRPAHVAVGDAPPTRDAIGALHEWRESLDALCTATRQAGAPELAAAAARLAAATALLRQNAVDDGRSSVPAVALESYPTADELGAAVAASQAQQHQLLAGQMAMDALHMHARS